MEGIPRSTNPPRRICVVTGSRAEYGILYWLLQEIRSDPLLTLQIVATGSHLSPEFGLTYKTIEADGLRIDRKVEVLMSSDTAIGTSKAVGLGVIGFADALSDLEPDIIVVTGDRFEILAAAQAAFFTGIPLAHISGGEVTLGAIDDGIRHCITKMSRYHFVAAERYRQRVIQLGELPQAVFNVGDPALDNVVRLKLMTRDELAASLDFDLTAPYLLTTYHPVTAGTGDSLLGMQALLDALDAYPTHSVVLTRPNADAGARALTGMIEEYASVRPNRVKIFTSLGQLRYLSAVRHCAAVVGNSSSGIVEAPAMGKPTVNIGPRQHGRLKATSIIDCDEVSGTITTALNKALSPSFAARAAQTTSLYGNCSASIRIKELLATLDTRRHFAKPFYDLGDLGRAEL
jgi:UDP-hydrolysing UDP-N-acetyl-D-glucosamine 2-epimerase